MPGYTGFDRSQVLTRGKISPVGVSASGLPGWSVSSHGQAWACAGCRLSGVVAIVVNLLLFVLSIVLVSFI